MLSMVPQQFLIRMQKCLLAVRHYSTNTLGGFRVLDLTRVLAGPYCTMILGDLGAEIIKIEKPVVGDDTRSWGPPFIGKQSCYFLSINRNKQSVCVDITKQEGSEIIKHLASESDVFIENYMPGKLEKYGLGYNDLRQINPKIVYCSISGYGCSGPYASRPGYDVIASSIGGMLHITGPSDGSPCKPGVAMTDLTTGLYAHGSIMAALLQRSVTGVGQKIEVNLLSTQVACLVNLGSNYLLANQEASRWGTAHESIVPYQAFSSSDGYLTIGAGNDRQFKQLCTRISRPDLAEDPQYATNALRVKNRCQLLTQIAETISTKSNEEWLSIFSDAPFPYGPINNLSQVFDDPQVKHNGMVQSVEHPSAGMIRLVGPAVKFGAMDNKIRSPPPELGQHTESVLRMFGYSADRIERLKNDGIVQ